MSSNHVIDSPSLKIILSATRIGKAHGLTKSCEPNLHPRLTVILTADVK